MKNGTTYAHDLFHKMFDDYTINVKEEFISPDDFDNRERFRLSTTLGVNTPFELFKKFFDKLNAHEYAQLDTFLLYGDSHSYTFSVIVCDEVKEKKNES